MSAFEVPRNEQHSVDLKRRTDRVMGKHASPYVYGVNKQRGGLDSFEGRIRARRTDGQATAQIGAGKAHKDKAGKGCDKDGKDGKDGGVEEVLEEKWDEAVEGVSRVFRYAASRALRVCVCVCARARARACVRACVHACALLLRVFWGAVQSRRLTTLDAAGGVGSAHRTIEW